MIDRGHSGRGGRDEPALSEYLRPWRKLWADQAHRNRTTEADIERIMAARGEE